MYLIINYRIEENVSEGITADAISDNLVKSVDQKSKTRGASHTFYRKLEAHSDSDFKNKYEDLKTQKYSIITYF